MHEFDSTSKMYSLLFFKFCTVTKAFREAPYACIYRAHAHILQ